MDNAQMLVRLQSRSIQCPGLLSPLSVIRRLEQAIIHSLLLKLLHRRLNGKHLPCECLGDEQQKRFVVSPHTWNKRRIQGLVVWARLVGKNLIWENIFPGAFGIYHAI